MRINLAIRILLLPTLITGLYRISRSNVLSLLRGLTSDSKLCLESVDDVNQS